MNSKKLYYILLGTGIFLCFMIVVTAFMVNKNLTARATKLTSLKAKNEALSQEQIIMKKAKQDVNSYSDLLKITRTVVPEDKSQAEAVREIVKLAGKNDVSLSAINFPSSSLGSGSTPAASASGTSAAASSPAPASANKATSASSKSLSQLLPVKNIPGVYQLQITVQGDTNKPVRYDKFINFLSDLEKNRRTAQVSTITLEPDKNNRNYLSFTLTLNEYIKP